MKPTEYATPTTEQWVDLKDVVVGPATRIGEAIIRMVKPRYRGKLQSSRTMLLFRGKAAEAVIDLGGSFRVQISRHGANVLRFTRDPDGAIKASMQKGHARIFLPQLTVWPDEDRPAEVVEWDASREWFEITLRADWATATLPALPPKKA